MNKQLIAVVAMTIWVGFVDGQPGINTSDKTIIDNTSPAAFKFEGKLAFHQNLPVGMVAGTSEHPQLLEIKSIRFENKFIDAWRVTACVGWLPVKDANWQLKVELLDDKNQVLRHPGDEVIVFTDKSSGSGEKTMRYADLDMDTMHKQQRRHARRFRIHLKPLREQIGSKGSADFETHTLEIVVVDHENQKPIANAAVVVSSLYYIKDKYRRNQTLYLTDSQGRCCINISTSKLLSLSINSQKQGFATTVKSWSNDGGHAIGSAPLINLPKRHVFEMTRGISIGGIVQDTESHGIGAAEVRFTAPDLEGPSGRAYVRSVQTDADGRWYVDGVPSEVNRVTLELRHPEYGSDNGRNRPIKGEALLNAKAMKHVEILVKGPTITGKVLDEQGRPVPRATVMLIRRVGYNFIHTITDVSGRFRFVCSEDEASYCAVVEAPGYAPALQTLDLQPNLGPLEFRLERGRTITCRVIDIQGQPIMGARTYVYPLPEILGTYYSLWLEDTDELGEFQIPNVLKNDVNLFVSKQGYITVRNSVLTASHDQITLTMKPEQSPSLNGKPLPSLNGIKIDIDADHAKDKMIIVCFFDRDQRPSRNCLQQLSKKAQELEAKGVVVIAIQASKIDENTLNEWVKKYKVSFPVGNVQDDEEKARFEWGVKSLPWLILTDKNHIVVAEGFGINELDDKIKQADN